MSKFEALNQIDYDKIAFIILLGLKPAQKNQFGFLINSPKYRMAIVQKYRSFPMPF